MCNANTSIRTCKFVSMIVVFLLTICLYCKNSNAEVVNLQCVHMSGAFTGKPFSATVDFDKSTIYMSGAMPENTPAHADITDQYITFRFRNTSNIVQTNRIDRITGILYFYITETNEWDTIFGNPGIVCKRAQKAF